MNETPMLFHMTPAEFWKQIRTTIEGAVNEKLNQQTLTPAITSLPEKALLKTSEVCAIFQVLKPTLYHWLKQKKLKSFKINSRRYFSRIDIEAIIQLFELQTRLRFQQIDRTNSHGCILERTSMECLPDAMELICS